MRKVYFPQFDGTARLKKDMLHGAVSDTTMEYIRTVFESIFTDEEKKLLSSFGLSKTDMLFCMGESLHEYGNEKGYFALRDGRRRLAGMFLGMILKGKPFFVAQISEGGIEKPVPLTAEFEGRDFPTRFTSWRYSYNLRHCHHKTKNFKAYVNTLEKYNRALNDRYKSKSLNENSFIEKYNMAVFLKNIKGQNAILTRNEAAFLYKNSIYLTFSNPSWLVNLIGLFGYSENMISLGDLFSAGEVFSFERSSPVEEQKHNIGQAFYDFIDLSDQNSTADKFAKMGLKLLYTQLPDKRHELPIYIGICRMAQAYSALLSDRVIGNSVREALGDKCQPVIRHIKSLCKEYGDEYEM